MTGPVDELLEQGRAALHAGDAVSARRAVKTRPRGSNRNADGSASGNILEGIAPAAYLELAFPHAIDSWEQSYAAHRASQDGVGAVLPG